ncbi:MAG TPA: inositol monophosphatase family protein [Acidimicrobiales bacterium]|nr:inositol monophosphatase family protein [Acidimicrobiales bacterium]
MRDDLFGPLEECAREIGDAVRAHQGRGFSGLRESQYHLDVAADEVALQILLGHGFRVVSEESGISGGGELTVVIDPVDGSTNCDRGVPFYSTSLAVLRDDELIAGLVVNLATGTAYRGEKGAGATRDGERITPSGRTQFVGSLMSFSGYPSRALEWSQIRALGAASLEICLVADGSLDVFAVAQGSALHPWDYLAGLVIARESGAGARDYRGDELVVIEPIGRRPAFAATDELLDAVMAVGPL